MSEPRAAYRVYDPECHLSLRALRSLDCLREGRDQRYDPPSAKAIRSLFAHAGWTQASVAERVRVNVSTVRRWTAPPDELEAKPIPYATWRLLLLESGAVSVQDGERLPFEDS